MKNKNLFYKNFLKKKTSGPEGFTGKFYQTLLLTIIYNLFQKIKEERMLPNSFNEASITVIPKSNKDILGRENQRPISLINMEAKLLNKI